MAFSLVFNLDKFSQALSPPGTGKISWTHTTAPSLQVVLEGSDITHSHAMLRLEVFEGTTLLEHAKLAEYIDSSKRVRDAARRAGASLRIEELPIFGITRDPTIALRYQTDGKARRLQLRLASSEDFHQMVSILLKRGMELSQHEHGTVRPDTSCSRPRTTQQNETPSISCPQNAQQNQPSSRPKMNPFHIPDIEAGSLSQRPKISPGARTGKPGQLAAPARESSRNGSLTSRSIPSHLLRPDVYDVQQSAERDTEETSAEGGVSLDVTRDEDGNSLQPSESGFGFGQAGLKVPPQRGWPTVEAHSHSSNPTSDAIEPRPSTARSITSATSFLHDNWENEMPPSRVLPFKTSGDMRPSSAVSSTASFTMPDTLELEIPPRRELPFKTTGSRGSGGTSRPGSALLLPPTKRAKPSKERPKTSSSAQGRPSESSRESSEPTKATRKPLQSSLSFVASKSTAVPAEDVAEDIAGEPLSMAQLVYGGGGFAGLRSRMNSTMDAPHEIEFPLDPAEKLHPFAIPQAPRFAPAATITSTETSSRCGRYDAATSPGKDAQEVDLDQYASQSPEARLTALNHFMIDKLQDPSFTTLCEDTEKCWRRMALGL